MSRPTAPEYVKAVSDRLSDTIDTLLEISVKLQRAKQAFLLLTKSFILQYKCEY